MLSILFHPIVMPSIGAALLLFGRTVMREVPLAVKLAMILAVLFYTLLLPLLVCTIVRYVRRLNSMTLLESPRVPMIVSAFCLLVCVVVLHQMVFSFLIFRVMLAAFCCIAVAIGVSFFERVNLHAVALGGMIGLMTVLCGVGIGQLQSAMVVVLLCGGLLCSAQLVEGGYNARQVGFSLLGGVVVSVAALIFG